MEFLKKRKLNFAFFILGIALFGLFLYKFGLDAFKIIKLQLNYKYFGMFLLAVVLSFIPYTMRFKAILEATHKDISFFRLFKHTVAAFAVSYVTPASRVGGEPVRIYMLKKECGVDYKTGTTAVVMDKFVEFLGTILYGVFGLFLLVSIPAVPNIAKIIFAILVGIGVF
ncbi:MAG: flippase-like domain-containing protein, partial [Nanoarchaeota archaeon]|nr:flippase-like domain-containing protein [Nanoarchaeota archaeon]